MSPVDLTTVGLLAPHEELREQLSNLQGLLMLSMLMTESGDERQILHLASTSVPSFGSCHLEGVHLSDKGWMTVAAGNASPDGDVQRTVGAQLSTLGPGGGLLLIPGRGWGWGLPLRGLHGHIGHLVVSAVQEPPPTEQFLLRVLAQHTGVALINARLHASERAAAEELAEANAAQAVILRKLERSTAIHDRLTRVAVAGEGQEGIARAVHELTGLPVAVEDRYGNLRAWAGPNRPIPYPKDPLARREQMLRRVLREGRPVREGGRLLAVACPRHDLLGVLVLVDPAGTAGEQEQVALEHGATVLAMELARLRSLADTELRVRRELVEELLAGADEQSALSRAQALGYDLERPHRVVLVEGRARTRDDDAFFHVVRRVARDTGVGTLMVARGATVVVLSDADQSWEDFRAAILGDLGGGVCKVGIGGRCERPSEIPRSYREAKYALALQDAANGTDQATSFDDLGVYRILSEVNNTAGVEQFVRSWLGKLLDYDARKHSDLVATLSRYLECGGNYEATATALMVHRSTLKYRLQRIREISGHDLNESDSRFNLQLATRAWRTLTALRSDLGAR
ncbi:MAG: helix-turn-helix domain-containing protein [Actinomycetota bacterium]|nr:helix-turn-helix domain-containing protein [Actinomycetota bacterium]